MATAVVIVATVVVRKVDQLDVEPAEQTLVAAAVAAPFEIKIHFNKS